MLLTMLLGGLRVPLRFAALTVAVVLAGALIFLSAGVFSFCAACIGGALATTALAAGAAAKFALLAGAIYLFAHFGNKSMEAPQWS